MKNHAYSEILIDDYGLKKRRASAGERQAIDQLRGDGYKVTTLETTPHGGLDIIARKGGRTRRIQVKRISSRIFATRESARNRIRGKPYQIDEIPQGLEIWVYDAVNHLYIFRE